MEEIMARGKLFSKFQFVGCVGYTKGDPCVGKTAPLRMFSGKMSGACEKHRKEILECQSILRMDWRIFRGKHPERYIPDYENCGYEIVVIKSLL